MDRIFPADVRELLAATGEQLLSLYLPLETPGEQWTQNRLLLKRQIDAAGAELASRGLSGRGTQEMLAPLFSLMSDERWLRSATPGLAAFATPDRTRLWRLPTAVREFCWVGPRFALKTLTPFVVGSACWVLAASAGGSQLYRADRWSLQLVPADLPGALPEALDYSPVDGAQQAHTGQPAARGKASAVFHGQGGEADAAKSVLDSYLRLLDRAVAPHLRDSDDPLVFVGVDYLYPIFERVTGYARLAGRVAGNPQSYTDAELHQRVLEVACPVWDAQRQRDVEEFERHRGSGQSSLELEAIVAAADSGRVATAFVAGDVERWGAIDGAARCARHVQRQADSEDLLDRIAVGALRCGGRVYVEAFDALPDRQPAAALFRYA